MTIENTVANAEAILADFLKARADTAARNVRDQSYMLIWDHPGSALFVAWDRQKNSAYASGFVAARVFLDWQAAQDFVDRTKIANGKGEAPTPIRVDDARARALRDYDGVIATVQKIVTNKQDQASA